MERFMSKVNKTETCWLWTAGLRHFGHGTFWIDGKNVRAHRWLYEQVKGKIPNGMDLRHTCDEPSCVNPNHLLIGTHADNMRDKVERNRQAKGETNGSAKLTEDNVREIRILKGFGFTGVELAKMYRVSSSNIYSILSSNTWNHIV